MRLDAYIRISALAGRDPNSEETRSHRTQRDEIVQWVDRRGYDFAPARHQQTS
jgi:hypothetical protein